VRQRPDFRRKRPDSILSWVGVDLEEPAGIAMGRTSILAVRRSVVARLFAVWLVALTVAPFTAPFAAFDVADLLPDGASRPLPASDSKYKEDIAGVIQLVMPFALATPTTVAPPFRGSLGLESRLNRSVVLRI